MHPSESVSKLQELSTAAGTPVASMGAREAVDRMLEFYRDVRAENCVTDEEGDMLLCQWGLYDWGGGASFQFNLTRQFIEPGDEDNEGMSQLSLTLHYAPTDVLLALSNGDLWCESPAGLAEYEQSIRAGDAFLAVTPLKPVKVDLEWAPV